MIFRRGFNKPHLNEGGEGGIGPGHHRLARHALHRRGGGEGVVAGAEVGGDGGGVGDVLGVGGEVVEREAGEVGVDPLELGGVVRHLAVIQPKQVFKLQLTSTTAWIH